MGAFDRELKQTVWLRDGGACFHCGVAVWEGDIHHRRPRMAGGGNARESWINALENLVLLCRDSHNWVEGNPGEARSLGFRVDAGVDPSDVLVRGWDELWYRLHVEDFKTPVTGLLAPLVGDPAPRWSLVT